MFGIMHHLKVTICENAMDAIAKGYSKEATYKDYKPVNIEEVVVVRDGTEGGNSTADLVLVDQEGNKYVVMVTGNLLKALPV
jgi:hypothetical protein